MTAMGVAAAIEVDVVLFNERGEQLLNSVDEVGKIPSSLSNTTETIQKFK